MYFCFMQQVRYRHLGLIPFQSAWQLQESLLAEIIDRKKKLQESRTPVHYLLLCQHPPVITLGKSGRENHLLIAPEILKEKGIEFYRINRGGDVTFHGPGQCVGYPILDLDFFFHDIHRYMRSLEEVIILTLADFGLKAGRIQGLTGVWINAEVASQARKICAFGVRCSRWVTMHGFALNVNTDLSFFNYIIPCGLQNKQVTSMEKELGVVTDLSKVEQTLCFYFQQVFNAELISDEIQKEPIGERNEKIH
jgi:lipoyl(octanoyl) transferase